MSGEVGTAEALEDLAIVHAEVLLEQVVDVERFEAVPEHDGNLQRLIKRYGDNPGSCPYIKSMGEAGIQLVQRLAEAEKNPNRGPTIRELMDANKNAIQNNIRSERPESFSAKIAATIKAEIQVDSRPTEKIIVDNFVDNSLVENVIRNVPSTVEDFSDPRTMLDTKNVRIIPSDNRHTSSVLETIVQESPLDIDVISFSETKQAMEPTSLAVELATDNQPLRAQVVERQVEVEYISHPEEYPFSTISEVTSNELVVEIADDIRIELNEYIDSLEPESAVAAEATLKSLIEIIQLNDIEISGSSENSPIDVKQIEHLFGELLQALNLDYKDETIKKLILELFTPELQLETHEVNELSVDQLNNLGTLEYKPVPGTSLLASLVQMIKQKISLHINLGKYALSASMA